VDRLRSEPQFYTEFMQQLGTSNPGLLATINQHPMMFMNLLMAGDPNAFQFGGPGAGAGAGVGGGMPPMGGMPGAGAGAGGPRQVQVSPQEMESIQRLEALGFQRVQCLEALRACDGNEEMAADFLFSTAMEDENQMMQSAVAQSSVGVNPSPAQPQPAQPEAPAQSNPATDATASAQ
jgi:UV excision repair protein RAD23